MTPEENPNELTQSDKDMAVIQHHAEILRAHFDSVQIFVTRQNDKEKKTVCADTGSGDWYARYGFIKTWVVHQDAYTAKYGLGDTQKDDD